MMHPCLPTLLLSSLIVTALAQAQEGDREIPTRAPITGLTGQSPEQPVGDVAIEVRRYGDLIATWDFWRGAPRPESVVERGRSDAKGRFAIEVPFGLLYDVRFEKPGFQRGRVVVGAGRPFLGPVVPGRIEDEPAAPKLGPPCLSARFRDRESGKPVAGARVRQPWGTRWLGTSGDDGTVLVGSLEKVQEDVLMVFAPGYRVLSIPKAHLVEPGGEVVERTYELERGPAIRGQLLSADGKAQAGIVVVAETDVSVGEDGIYSSVAWWTRTDGEGRYSLSGFVPGGRYWVRTLLDRDVPMELGRGRLAASSQDLDLGVARTGPTFAVQGKVTHQGKVLGREGRVHVLRLSAEEVHQKLVARNTPSFPIEPGGLYRIPELTPGQYELCFWVDGLEHEVRVVRPPLSGDAVRLDVDMGPGRTLAGKVVDAEGKGVADVLLRAMVWKDEYQVLVPNGDLSHNGRYLVGNIRVKTREDGSFRLERVRTRVPILLLALPEGQPPVQMRIEADAPGEGLEVELETR